MEWFARNVTEELMNVDVAVVTNSICVIIGYTDVYCETEINECSSDPCQGQGNCTDLLNSFSCSCYAGLVQPVLVLVPSLEGNCICMVP